MKKRPYAKATFILAVIAFGLAAAPPTTYTGMVTAVHDGDSLTATVNGETWKVRLSDIDAPELAVGFKAAQPYSSTAAGVLDDLVLRKEVTLSVQSKPDEHGRKLARAFVDGVDVNLRMVETGAAWWYPQFAHGKENRAALKAAQEKAQADKVGLWKLDGPVPPWDWRKGKR